MVANLVLATLSYVASSTRKAARPGRIPISLSVVTARAGIQKSVATDGIGRSPR